MAEALWQQIRASLSDDITAGRYPSGARLPSEASLSARFGVNRHTVRRALKALQDAGAVHARRGAGVFVTGAHLSYRLGRRTRFSQNLAEMGLKGSREYLRMETVPASRDEARALKLEPGALVHMVEGVSFADNVPICHASGVFPAGPLPDFLKALRDTDSVTAALSMCGVTDYRRLSTRLVAERAEGVTARHLRLPDGAPILRAIGINVDAEGVPVEFGTSRFAADRVELLVEEGGFA